MFWGFTYPHPARQWGQQERGPKPMTKEEEEKEKEEVRKNGNGEVRGGRGVWLPSRRTSEKNCLLT